MAPVSEYEQKRAALIARNREILRNLGIEKPSWGPPPPKEHKPKPHKPRHVPKPEAGEDQEEGEGMRRSSRRIRKLDTEFCPVCLRPTAEGDHSECVARDIESDLETEKKAPRPRGPSSRGPYDLEQKLSELGLGGLVDFTEDKGASGRAEFVVIGSTGEPFANITRIQSDVAHVRKPRFVFTGNHYIISLTDERHTCQCVDFRTRGKFRPCKHLKLLFRTMGLPDSGVGDWRSAVHDAIEGGADVFGEADSSDRQRVEQRKIRREKAAEKARLKEEQYDEVKTDVKVEPEEEEPQSVKEPAPPRKKKRGRK